MGSSREVGAGDPCVWESALGICGAWHQHPPLRGCPQEIQPQGRCFSSWANRNGGLEWENTNWSRKGGERAGRDSTALGAAGGVVWKCGQREETPALGFSHGTDFPEETLTWVCAGAASACGAGQGFCVFLPFPAESCPPPPPTGSRRAGRCTRSRLRSRGRCRL